MSFMLNSLSKYLKIAYECATFASLPDVKKKSKIITFHLHERKQVNRLDEKKCTKKNLLKMGKQGL